MRKKSKVPIHFHNLYLHIGKLCNVTIHYLQFDGGSEYTSNRFQSYLSSSEISHRKSCPHASYQNDLEERKIQHLVETMRTLLIHA